MAHPQVERQLILLSAGTTVRRLAMHEQAERLIAEVDWPRLTETLRWRRLLPALGPRILELADNHPSDGFAAAVEEAIEAGRRQGAFLQLISWRVMSALAEAGIPSTPLKGAQLGEAIYGDPGRRLSTDVDLLVAPEQLQAAVEAVRRLGYGPPSDHVDERGLPRLHFALIHERGELPPVELHWRVHWYERSFAGERLLPPAGDRSDNWRPAPAAELAALLLFYARDGFIDLRLAADLSAWWDTFGACLRPQAFNDLLDVYPALARVLRVAVKVGERMVGLPVRQIMGDMPKLRLRDRAAVRLANPHPHTSPSQLYADMGLIDGLLMPPGGFGAFVRRQLLLPREVLDQRAQRAPERRTRSSLVYGARLLVRCGVLARYGLAATRLVRGPESLSLT